MHAVPRVVDIIEPPANGEDENVGWNGQGRKQGWPRWGVHEYDPDSRKADLD